MRIVKAFFAHVSNFELTLKGKPVAPGIAVGQVLVLKSFDIVEIKKNSRQIENIATETSKLEQACRISTAQVSKTLEDVRQHGSPNSVAIFSAYQSLLM